MDKVSTDLTCFVGTGARNGGIKMINQNATPISKIDGSDKSQVQISGNEENDNSRQDNDTGKGGSIELFSDNDVHRLTSQQKLPRSSSISNINRRSRKNQSVSYEKLKKIKATVDKAIQEHKVFIVYGRFKSVRAALKERGWIEKCNSRKYKRARTVAALQVDEDDSPYNFIDTPDSSDEDLTESLLISRLLRHKQPDLIWTMRHEALEWRLLTKDQLISRYPNSYFTTKVGLCTFLQQLHWFCEAKVSETFFPRCFNVGQPDELTAFVENYRLTACISLLKWLVDHGETVYSEEGKVPWKAVEFAMKRVSEYIRFQKHEDIDMRDTTRVWEHQWSQFLLWYTMAVHEGAGITGSKYLSVKDTLQTIRLTIEKVKQFWPQLNIDGVLNIWIMKPAARSRGRGISLVSSIDNVMCKINSSLQHTSKFVVQKYLERPLLICNTKFDIRQWFLVTDVQPLTIWMYKESYLRFCSQSFSLSNYHESVHLCNNSVQSKYKNGERDDFLPDENMWDSYTFQAYLRTIDQTDMWGERIYPGMKKGIIGAMLASQEHMDIRKNCFELYGADFMISEDFYPWLIEINSCPCMAPTTSITARMCPQCLEDVIKVVIDRRDNDSAEIGMFELIYKQHTVSAPPYMGVSFTIQGTKLSMNAKNGKVKKGPEDSAEVYDLKPLFEAHQKGESGKQNAPDTVTSINLDKETSLGDADLKWAQSSDVKTLHETKRHSSEPSIKLGHKDGSRSTNGNSKPHTERIRFKLHASRKGAAISHDTKDTKVNQEETDEAKAPDEKSTACEQAPETVSGENNPSGEEQLFQRRENCATKYWKNHQAYKSLELLKEWREKLQQTRVNCEIMLTNLQLFKENEKAIANNNNTSTDKCCLWDQKKSHAKTTEETASHENLPVPPKEPHSIRPKNSNHKSRRSNSRLPMTPPVYVPVIDKNPSYSLFKGPLPCIKQKNKLSSYKNSDLCKFRKLKEIDFCYDALKSSVARKNNVMLPVNSTYCLKINSKEYVNTVCENM